MRNSFYYKFKVPNLFTSKDTTTAVQQPKRGLWNWKTLKVFEIYQYNLKKLAKC